VLVTVVAPPSLEATATAAPTATAAVVTATVVAVPAAAAEAAAPPAAAPLEPAPAPAAAAVSVAAKAAPEKLTASAATKAIFFIMIPIKYKRLYIEAKLQPLSVVQLKQLIDHDSE
jgi:hypothetical protein